MSDITSIDQSYRLATSVEVGKFTCLVADTSAYADGCQVPAAANAAFLGIAQESIIPDAIADYVAGQYTITSGTAWPANSIPAASAGRNIRTRLFGISRAVVGVVPINRGDELNIADNQGRVKTVNEAAGTLVYVIGIAIDAPTNVGDVIRVLVLGYRKKT